MSIEIPVTIEECRSLYARIRARSEARTARDFDAAVRAYFRDHGMLGPNGAEVIAPKDLPPTSWVEAALAVRFTCRRCAGTGAFVTYVENGQPKGPGGPCFRCAGRGTQNDTDVRRNFTHDRYYVNRAYA
jgi:hypothetical protein